MGDIPTLMTIAYILAVLPSTIFAPLFTSIPSFATASALIMVGFSLGRLNFSQKLAKCRKTTLILLR